MQAQNPWQLNQRNAEQADKEAIKITNSLLYIEPMSTCTPATATYEVYLRQREWLARYMMERKRIFNELTVAPAVEAVIQDISTKKYVPKFGNGAYYGMRED